MAKAAKNTTGSNSNDGSDVPPELSFSLPSIKDIQASIKDQNDLNLPVEILLVTVTNCEFIACYMQLEDPFKCYFHGIGFVYFGHEGAGQEKKVNVALIKCDKGSASPGGSLVSVKNAVTVLRPKGVISVGTCSGLNPEKTKLGDVVVSAKLSTYAFKVVTSKGEQSADTRSYVSRHFLDLIKYADHGWKAPLKSPEAREVKVHCGEILSGPERVSAGWRREELAESYPVATAIEMEGEGIFTAAFDLQIEWLVVKGIADYADGTESVSENWSPFASVMAASVVANILNDPVVFREWPHYKEKQSSSQQSERVVLSTSGEDPKRFKVEVAFKEGKPSDRDLNELAGKIGTKWNNLGLQLGISQDVLSGIETNGKDRPYEMLLRWKDTTSSNALYRDLYHALCSDRVGLDNVAKEFCCRETT